MVSERIYIEKLKELLKRKRISYLKLGEKLGKSEQTIINYLKGRTKIDVDTLMKLSEILGVTPCYFFDCGQSSTAQLSQSDELEKIKMLEQIIKEKDNQIELLREMINMLKSQ